MIRYIKWMFIQKRDLNPHYRMNCGMSFRTYSNQSSNLHALWCCSYKRLWYFVEIQGYIHSVQFWNKFPQYIHGGKTGQLIFLRESRLGNLSSLRGYWTGRLGKKWGRLVFNEWYGLRVIDFNVEWIYFLG